jgi:oligogalacturonide transporter
VLGGHYTVHEVNRDETMTESPTANASRPVKVRNLVAYGLGDVFGGGSFLIINMFFLFFLTEVVGLSPILAGIVFSFGKVWDAISDPLMGYLSDRTRSRFGRRRVFFLIGIAPIAVSFVLIWMPPPSEEDLLNVAYYAFAYVFFSTVVTMVMVPYSALNAEMSTDYKVRTRLSGARILFSEIASLVAATVPSLIIRSFESAEQGHLVMGVVFGVIFALPWVFVFRGTWELPHFESRKDPFSLRQAFSEFASLFRNRSFLVHILMYLFAFTAIDCLMILFKYYLHWNIGRPDLFAVSMGTLMLTQIAMIGLYVFLANRKGKGFTYRVGLVVWSVGMLLAFFLDRETPVGALLLVCGLMGAGLSAGAMIPWAILPSVIDVDEMITTKSRAGIYSGAMTLVRKLVQGLIAAPAIGIALELIGYVEKSPSQSDEVVSGLKLLFFCAPFACLVLGIGISFFFHITPSTHAVFKQELSRLREGGSKSDVQPEARAVAERLTGVQYTELYKG